MHNADLRELALKLGVFALPALTAQLATVLERLKAVNCLSLNITLPHKQAVAAPVAEYTIYI